MDKPESKHPEPKHSAAVPVAPGPDQHAEPEDTSKGQPVEQRQVHAVHEVKAPPPPEPEEATLGGEPPKPAAKPAQNQHK